MADPLPLPQGRTRPWEDGENEDVSEDARELAVLGSNNTPAVAMTFPIHDLQHWIDLCA